MWATSTNDFSDANIGSVDVGTGTSVDTRYGLDSSQVSISNIPPADQTAYLKCFISFNVPKDSTLFNQQLDISGWTSTEDTFLVASTEFT
jgi:hypothetical protein